MHQLEYPVQVACNCLTIDNTKSRLHHLAHWLLSLSWANYSSSTTLSRSLAFFVLLMKLIKFGISQHEHTPNSREWERIRRREPQLCVDTVMRINIFPRHWTSSLAKKENLYRFYFSPPHHSLLFSQCIERYFVQQRAQRHGKDNAKWIEDFPSSGKSKKRREREKKGKILYCKKKPQLSLLVCASSLASNAMSCMKVSQVTLIWGERELGEGGILTRAVQHWCACWRKIQSFFLFSIQHNSSHFCWLCDAIAFISAQTIPIFPHRDWINKNVYTIFIHHSAAAF